MYVYISVVITILVSIYFLVLCTGKKKKVKENISVLNYQPHNHSRNSSDVEAAISPTPAETVSNSHNTNTGSNAKHEEKRSHSASQSSQVRELPYPPALMEDHKPNSQRHSLDSSEHLDLGVGEQSKHQSPKGRRLPAPPPDTALIVTNTDNKSYHDEDPYASVDDDDRADEVKPDPIPLKIKTLDIKEGSGDSSFYAKVADAPEETALYAQVDDKHVKAKQEETQASTSAPPLSNNSKSQSDAFPAPEYASIDRVKKGMSIKRKSAGDQTGECNEPPAPPIPDRNFDADDERGSDQSSGDETEEKEEEDEEEKVPMYDKLCVRESLDHLRKREEVEKERRERYENLPCINGVESSSDLYAQIDENRPEAVYESLSQPGSADGAYLPGANNADYSSIRELDVGNGSLANDQPPASLQSRPQRRHHYEQIDQPPVT